ncbi:FUSC family protein, partial [Clostridium tertium]
FNCFGALTAAVPVLGLVGAIIFRIFNNAFGAVYSKLFNKVFDIVDSKIFVGNTMDEAMEG